MKTAVTFDYAFALPHRLCVCMPEGSHKTLCDAYADHFSLSWSDENLTQLPYGAFRSPRVQWKIDFIAEIGGQPMKGKRWHRYENRLPVFVYEFENTEKCGAEMIVTVSAGTMCDIVRIEMHNKTDEEIDFGIFAKMGGVVFNLLWMEPDAQTNMLLPTMGDRSDRVLLLTKDGKCEKPRGAGVCQIKTVLQPGQTQICHYIRPYQATINDTDRLLDLDCEGISEKNIAVWQWIVERAPKLSIPDKAVLDAYYAGLCDIFVHREKMSDGRVTGIAGTEVYRAMNTAEPVMGCVILSQNGFLEESVKGMLPLLDIQDSKTGRWDDFRLWGHHMAWITGFRCIWMKEHYQITRDRAMLWEWYSHLARHCEFMRAQSLKTKNDPNPLYRGLLPRGMGDGGLMDDNDLFGVFYPNSLMHTAILKIAAWAADELGQPDESKTFTAWAKELGDDIKASLCNGGAIQEDGFAWIPGTPAKTSGSRFAALWADYATGILEPFDILISGTLKKLEGNLSEGGMPVDLGWLSGGVWAAMALDQLAYAHISRGEYDQAASYLIPTLNHGTPFYSWCEERLPEKGTERVTGDRQHLWTPIAVTKFLRDCLCFENSTCDKTPDTLHLAMTTQREWLSDGGEVGIENATTAFGLLTYKLKRNGDTLALHVELTNAREAQLKAIVAHLRLPQKDVCLTVVTSSGCTTHITGKECELTPSSDTMDIIIRIG